MWSKNPFVSPILKRYVRTEQIVGEKSSSKKEKNCVQVVIRIFVRDALTSKTFAFFIFYLFIFFIFFQFKITWLYFSNKRNKSQKNKLMKKVKFEGDK